MRLVLLASLLAAVPALGCAKTLRDPQEAKIVSDAAYHRTVARNNELRREFYSTAASGKGSAKLQRVWYTTEERPVLDILEVNHGKVKFTSNYFWDTYAPLEMRLKPETDTVSNLQLGYIDPPGPTPTPERDLPASKKFVPVNVDAPASPDRELLLRFDFDGVQKPSVGRF